MSFTELFELNPSKLREISTLGNLEFSGSLVIYGWNTGVYGWFGYPSIITDPPSLADHPSLADRPRSAGSQYSYIQEDISSLLSRNRILLVSGRDFSGDTNLGLYHKQNSIRFNFSCKNLVAEGLDGLQFLFSFDFATYRPNEIQIFLEYEHIETVTITNRRKVTFLVELLKDEDNLLDISGLMFNIRPAKIHHEFYFYSVQVSVLI
ncbi:MAG: hypothetical protein ACFE8C_11030 [Promethearchaeota archaeon]